MAQYVLVADDDPDTLMMVTDIVDSIGVPWRSARDGQEALDMARSERPAALVLDLMMPVVDGHAVLGELQADPALSDVPVIVLSAYVDEYEYSMQGQPGVLAVISKGRSHHEQLRQLLTQALGG